MQLTVESDELGGSATREAPIEPSQGMGAAEEPEGDDDVADKKDNDVDDKKTDDVNGSKKTFSHDALIFVMIYLCTEPLAFLDIAEEPKPIGPSNSDISPAKLLASAAASAQAAGDNTNGVIGGGGTAGRGGKPPTLEEKKVAALEDAARNAAASARATMDIAQTTRSRLAADASEALVQSYKDDIKELKEEMAEMSDEEEKEASKKKLKALIVLREDAKRQRIETLTAAAEGPASSLRLAAAPTVAPAAAQIAPPTAAEVPAPAPVTATC